MIKASLLFFFFIIINTCRVYSQEAIVAGIVMDNKTGVAVEGANILTIKSEQIIYQTVTDSLGRFKIPLRFYVQMNYIKISDINYETFKIERQDQSRNTGNNVINLGVFKIKAIEIKLKEVKVISTKRYTDTSRIDLSKEKFERSVMIDDIFSRYGFTKGTNGILYYKGKPVSGITVNGDDFFGKNNLDVYHLLPALVLNNIDVVETNIDSLTNTTQLRPSIKVDLKFKEKYNAGMFGNANLGIGTLNRYLANTNLFYYRNKQQISLIAGSNNINADDNLIVPPTVNFSAGSNDVLKTNAKLTYRNILAKKIEVNFLIDGNVTNRTYTSETDRNDDELHQLSNTVNLSKIKAFNINNADLSLNYKPDALSALTITQNVKYEQLTSRDSLNYNIITDTSNSISKDFQMRKYNTVGYAGKVDYSRRFTSKKGRSLNVKAGFNKTNYQTNENDNVYASDNTTINKYFIDEKINAGESLLMLDANFTEPIGLNGYLNILLSYKNDRMTYNYTVNSDTLVNYLSPAALINNQYFTPGLKIQHTYSNFDLLGDASGIFYSTDIKSSENRQNDFFKINGSLNADFKITTKKDLTLTYSAHTTFPEINQLSSIGSTLDLVSQTTGNINLKPEDKQTFRVTYNIRSSGSKAISFDGEADYYTNKFGYNVSSNSTTPIMLVANVGDAKTATFGFNLSDNLFGRYFFNSSSAISYLQQPSIVNGQYTANNGLSLSQSFSSNITLMGTRLIVSPIITTSASRYFYSTGNANVINFTGSGKISFNVAGFQSALYPLFNYSYNVVHNSSFSMNGEVRKSLFKDQMVIWLQGYDLFNSFKFFNTYVGPTYTESTRFTNLQRYVFFGVSFKFSNLK